ncbi:MAG: hypothetical protein HUU02_09800 [Bacteroidetes bacterium]|nr:hypothetical protein [Bacteroidota bacterium]
MKTIVLLLLLFVSTSVVAASQDDTTCIFVGSEYSGQIYNNGLYVSSKGVIKSLAIFIQFQGDNSYSGSTAWPVNQPPTFLNTYLDSITSQSSTPWSISHYFRESSLDSLRIIGKGYSVITQYTEAY